MKWTKAWRKSHGKELTKDTVFEFEKKRNEPLIYNRDTYVNTVQAMQKISDIATSRESRFIETRMKASKRKQINTLDVVAEKHAHLIEEPKLREKIKTKKIQKENTKNKVTTRSKKKNSMELE